MDKDTFLTELRARLAGLPQDETDGRIAFYSEMIDDRMEDGAFEAEAVEEIGPVDEVASQIISEFPLRRLVKEKIAPRREMGAGGKALLILGFPLWFALLIAAGGVIFSFYICIGAIVVSLWSVEAALWAGALGCLAGAVFFAVKGNWPTALLAFGAALVLAGLSFFLLIGCIAATKGLIKLTRKVILAIKARLIRRDGSK